MTTTTDDPQDTRDASRPERVLEVENAAIGALHDPGRIVVEGVDWRVERGEFWAVGGLLGAGKTDFLMLLAGLTEPVRGVRRLFGNESRSGQDRDVHRPRVGLVFDGGQLLHHMTIGENVALPLRYHRNCATEDCAADVDRLLAFTRTRALAGKRPGEISRNWRQRAGLARALALQPDLLLLDSPLSGLDPRQARWWLDTLGALAAGHEIMEGRPVTMVVTTHELTAWTTVANRFAILRDRRLILPKQGTDPAEAAEQLNRELMRMEPEID